MTGMEICSVMLQPAGKQNNNNKEWQLLVKSVIKPIDNKANWKTMATRLKKSTTVHL